MACRTEPVDEHPPSIYRRSLLIAAGHERDVRAGFSAHPRRANERFAPRQINGSARGLALTRPGFRHE
jgi:hypothetical protein